MTPVSRLIDPAPADQDLRLMAQVAAHDPEAQRRVATRLAPRVRRLCHLLMRERADAEDATQLALMEILRSAHAYRFDHSLERWADRITVRAVARQAREQRRTSALVDRQIDPEALPAGPAGWGPSERTPNGVQSYLARLGRERREAFVLKHALGYTVEEIAELTCAPTGTVKDRLVAARKALRRMIDAEIRGIRPPGRSG